MWGTVGWSMMFAIGAKLPSPNLSIGDKWISPRYDAVAARRQPFVSYTPSKDNFLIHANLCTSVRITPPVKVPKRYLPR